MLISVSNVHRNVIYFWAGSKLYGKNNPEPVNGRIVNKKKNKSVEECTRCTLHALFHYVSILSLQYKQHKRRFYGIMRFGCELKMRCILSHFPRLWQSQMSTNQMTVEMGNSFTNFMPRHMHISLPFSPHISLSLSLVANHILASSRIKSQRHELRAFFEVSQTKQTFFLFWFDFVEWAKVLGERQRGTEIFKRATQKQQEKNATTNASSRKLKSI